MNPRGRHTGDAKPVQTVLKTTMKTEINPENSVYRQVIEGLSSAVLLFDDKLSLLYINPTGEMLFELSSKRLLGSSLDSLLPKDNHLIERITNSSKTGHPFTDREISLNLPAPRTIKVDCTITPMVDSYDKKTLLIEFVHVDRSLRISREETQLMQNNALRALIRGLAHEVKNPLGGLRGAAQLLERELPDDSLKEYTQIIIGEADRLHNLVDRMLGPNTLPQKQAVNIHEVTEHVRQLIEAEAPTGILIRTDYDPSIPEIIADRDQLIQAILNIIRNAVQAIKEYGSIIIRTRTLRQFTIAHTRHKLVCKIDIIDNGPGIPSDMIDTIFFPMITGHAEGSGLGLSLSQTLIQQHHGIILCESQPGNTKFSIVLPLNQN